MMFKKQNKCTLIKSMCLIALSFFSTYAYSEDVPNGCTYTGQTCVEAGGTKTVGGIDVYSDCWKYQKNYSCKQTPTVDECTPYENSCQLGSVQQCLATIGGLCVEYNYTYECPKQVCDGVNLYCGNNIFCIDGDCATQTPTQNKDFGQDVSELAAVTGAIDDFNANDHVNMFSGQAKECSVDAAGFKDCCQDSGWGTNIGLAQCSDDEKQLGEDKKHYLVSYIGEYCHNKVLGVCTSYHKVYCVWDNTMARITQDYGRPQIGLTMGSPESPNCSGFTIDQFAELDFNAMNFVDPIYIYPYGSPNQAAGLAGDMSVNSPSDDEMSDAITQRIEDDINNNTPTPSTSDDQALAQSQHRLQQAVMAQVSPQSHVSSK